MKLDQAEVMVALTEPRELRALEAGIRLAGLVGSDFDKEVFHAAHEEDLYERHYDGAVSGPVWAPAIEPVLPVTAENVREVRHSLDAVVSFGGLRQTFLGNKRTARRLLDQLPPTLEV